MLHIYSIHVAHIQHTCCTHTAYMLHIYNIHVAHTQHTCYIILCLHLLPHIQDTWTAHTQHTCCTYTTYMLHKPYLAHIYSIHGALQHTGMLGRYTANVYSIHVAHIQHTCCTLIQHTCCTYTAYMLHIQHTCCTYTAYMFTLIQHTRCTYTAYMLIDTGIHKLHVYSSTSPQIRKNVCTYTAVHASHHTFSRYMLLWRTANTLNAHRAYCCNICYLWRRNRVVITGFIKIDFLSRKGIY